MKVRVPPMRRQLPTSTPYRVDSFESFEVITEGKPGESVWDALPDAADLAKIRTLQVADLDAQEKAFRARWDVPVPKANDHPIGFHEEPPARAPMPDVPRTPEQKAATAESAAAWVAPPQRSVGPVKPTLVHKTPDGKDFTPGVNVAAAQRLCVDPEHNRNDAKNARVRGVISAQEYDGSMSRIGRPLCSHHHAKAAKR